MRPYVVIVIQMSCRIHMSFLKDSKAPKLYNKKMRKKPCGVLSQTNAKELYLLYNLEKREP